MRIELEGYMIDGTPAEMLELLDLLADEVAAVEEPKPKPAAKPTGKKIDWAKAAALRNAGWSYAKIGDELGVSDVTVAAHLKK